MESRSERNSILLRKIRFNVHNLRVAYRIISHKNSLFFLELFKQFILSRSLSLCMHMYAFNLSTQIFLHSTDIIIRAFSVSSSSRNRSWQQTYRRWHTSIVNSRSLHVVKAKRDKRSEALSMHISSIRQATNWNLDL